MPLERVRIAEVTRGPFVRDVSAQGTVVAAVSPTLFAAAPGTVHFLVQAGDVVKKDQPIATLDSPELRNELEREQASLAGLEVAVQRQGIDTRRQLLANQQASDLANVEHPGRGARAAARRGFVGQAAHQRARLREGARRCRRRARQSQARDRDRRRCRRKACEFELRARRLERDRQRLVVQELQRRVGDLNMKSPVDGVVGTLAVAERASVAQNAPLLTVVDLTAFEIEFQVPESYADDLGLGMDAEVTYAARKYAAKVSAVSPEVRQGQVTGRLRFSGETPQGLRQNQRVSTRIVLESRDDVLKVQRGPFLDTGGGRVAYVVQDDVAVRTPIQTGADQRDRSRDPRRPRARRSDHHFKPRRVRARRNRATDGLRSAVKALDYSHLLAD